MKYQILNRIVQKKKHTATMRDNFRTLAAVQLNAESELFGGVR